jgi:phosphonate transport system substrate-binding protein
VVTILRYLLVIFFLLLPGITCLAAENRTYTVGIVPQQAATELIRSWGPLLEELSRQSGVTLRFRTANNIDAFEERLHVAEYDFAYMNPYHYVVFSEHSGYRALAHEKDKRIQGIIVTHKDSGIKAIGQLRGKRLAFPSHAAFAASILPRAEFKKQDSDIESRYVGSHDSVYHLVARKRYPAGGGINRTFNAIKPDIRNQLRILWTSQSYTPHAFAANRHVPESISKAVQTAITQLHTTAKGKKYLDKAHLNGFQIAKDADWDDIRLLDITALE